ncbi:hypothetical protein DFJ74DRAFT_710055 [Hyaloraphidium curvatum]|nr:hypothetical protein DFJ74DRAFT_710055 [Hyaloraphidium curvatum]
MEDRLGVKDSFFDDDDEDEAPLGSRKSVLGGRMKGKASMGSDSEESGLESRERSGDENYGSDPGSDEDSDEAADPKASSRASKRKKVHKDKSRPAELSSKKAVGRARIVVKTGEVKRRDPRFDDRTGNFNNGVFANSYNFVFDLHKKEMSELRQKISVEKDPEERGRLKQLLTSLQSRDKARQAEEAKQKIKREWRKKQSERVKQGKKPFFLKDSDIKRIELMEQFRKTNPKDLERKLEKRRKHNASKDHKRMPYARNQD